MSMFYCARCDGLCDADDGCEEDPDNALELICVDCAADLEEPPLPPERDLAALSGQAPEEP